MNTYKGPYTLYIEQSDSTCLIRIDSNLTMLKALSSVRSLYEILRFAWCIIIDNEGKQVNIHEPFMADGVPYDLSKG